LGDTAAVELWIQGASLGPLETPAGVAQPMGAKVDIPCADFWYLRNGKIERFDCYAMSSTMLAQIGVRPDFASAVAAPAAAALERAGQLLSAHLASAERVTA
jgi:hypothetical protein